MLGSGFKLFGSAGLNLKWHLANDVTLDAAFNPDFAQVEADQVILNLTNFETFLPEKRPFFLEGIDAFSFPLQVFYSRRIGARRSRRRSGPAQTLGGRPVARHHLRRGQGGRAPGTRLDAGRAQRHHGGEPGHGREHRDGDDVEPDRRARRPRSTSCASSASSATPATSASSAPARRRSTTRTRSATRYLRRRSTAAGARSRARLRRQRRASSQSYIHRRRRRPVVHPRRTRTAARRHADRRRARPRPAAGCASPRRAASTCCGAPSTPAPAGRCSTTTSATWRGRTCTC